MLLSSEFSAFLSIYYMMSIHVVSLAQILASFGFKIIYIYIYIKLENLETLGWHGNGEEIQLFFTFVLSLNIS